MYRREARSRFELSEEIQRDCDEVRKHLLAHHTYAHRVQDLVAALKE